MKVIFLSAFFILIPYQIIDGASNADQNNTEFLAPDIRASQKFFVGMQELAHSMRCDWSLYALEKGVGTFSDTYRFNNTLARVTFNACVFIPELRQRSEILSVRLSESDLDMLQEHLLIIQNHVIEMAETQGLESQVPLLLRNAHRADGAAIDKFRHKALSTIGKALGVRDIVHHEQEENLSEMLYNFEKIGPLASYIQVSKFRKEDNYRAEDINNSLEKIKPILQKTKV